MMDFTSYKAESGFLENTWSLKILREMHLEKTRRAGDLEWHLIEHLCCWGFPDDSSIHPNLVVNYFNSDVLSFNNIKTVINDFIQSIKLIYYRR